MDTGVAVTLDVDRVSEASYTSATVERLHCCFVGGGLPFLRCYA